MQASNQIKHFTCQLHPSETIQRVCLDSDAGSSLRCIECILDSTEKGSMIAFDEFIDNAAKQYQSFQRASIFDTAPPEELTNFLAQENENIQRLSQYIEQEKQRVNESFNIMIQEFTQLCCRKKNEIASQLNMQLATLKFNYSYYNSKLERYSHKDNELNPPDRDTLVSKINQCKDINQAEVLVKNIKDDLLEASSHESPDNIKEILLQISQAFQDQANTLPNTKFCDQTAIDASLNAFREATDSLMEDFDEVDNQIFEISFPNFLSIDSNLIIKQEHLNLLKKWLTPSEKDYQLRLLYRGTRDGMSYEAFQKKCDNHEKTLTIAKSNHGKVFGGYTDQKWNYTNNYKTSRDSWLFSIDEKLKFPIMEDGISNAIYACAGYGPTFGSGHDLYIHFSSNYKEESSSHSELGHSYQMNFNSKSSKRVKGDETENQTILAGSYQFNVEELEIYAVENRNNKYL